MNKAEAGRLGGLATLRKHGRQHFSTIGKKGYKTMAARYKLVPYGISDWAFINKSGQVIALLSGRHKQP